MQHSFQGLGPKPVQVTQQIAPFSRRIVNSSFVDEAIKKTNQPLVLDDDAKSSVLFYMERFVDKLLKETAEATKLRESKQVQRKDVEFALQTKFAKDSTPFH